MKIVLNNKFLYFIVGLIFVSIIFNYLLKSNVILSIPEISLSNEYLCKVNGEDCLIIKNMAFDSKEFNRVEVCASFTSNKSTSVAVYLTIPTQGPIFGGKSADINKGNTQVCYYLHELVEFWQTSSSIAENNISPVNNGNIKPGQYMIVFERGREVLGSFSFLVTESE